MDSQRYESWKLMQSVFEAAQGKMKARVDSEPLGDLLQPRGPAATKKEHLSTAIRQGTVRLKPSSSSDAPLHKMPQGS